MSNWNEYVFSSSFYRAERPARDPEFQIEICIEFSKDPMAKDPSIQLSKISAEVQRCLKIQLGPRLGRTDCAAACYRSTVQWSNLPYTGFDYFIPTLVRMSSLHLIAYTSEESFIRISPSDVAFLAMIVELETWNPAELSDLFYSSKSNKSNKSTEQKIRKKISKNLKSWKIWWNLYYEYTIIMTTASWHIPSASCFLRLPRRFFLSRPLLRLYR